MVELIVGGLGVLFGLAVLVGHGLDREARDSAWQRIASARRANHEAARELEEREHLLQVWEDALDRRERRLDHREQQALEREDLLERMERQLRVAPPAESEPGLAS